MKTIDLIKAVEAGELTQSAIIPDDINPYEIIRTRDFKTLKKLAAQSNAFEFLRKTETWPKTSERQFILGNMDHLCNFLKEVSANTCGCCALPYNDFSPEFEEKSGRIRILQFSSDENHFEEEWECICINCNSTYIVTRSEVRFGHQTLWLKK